MLLHCFSWIENSGLGHAIRASSWLFPVIEAFHLAGLAMLGGAVIMVDMRLFGMGLKEQPVGRVARDVQPLLLGSLALMLISGPLLFMSESVKCYYSTAFWVKMTFLVLAIAYTFTLHRKMIAHADGATATSFPGRLAAIVSIILWSGVGIGGRWIGFQ